MLCPHCVDIQSLQGVCCRASRFALLTLCTLNACERDPVSKSAATTGSGTPSAAPVSGPRIISTVPAATEQLLQIGAADLLVGVSTYDAPILPPGKENLPVVGDYDTLDYELLVKLRPTALVVQMTPSHITSALQKIIADQHIELVNVKLDSLSDLYATAAALGRISGHQKEADSAIAATAHRPGGYRCANGPMVRSRALPIC